MDLEERGDLGVLGGSRGRGNCTKKKKKKEKGKKTPCREWYY